MKSNCVELDAVTQAEHVSGDLHIDILLVEGNPFLICVAQPVFYAMLRLLGSLGEDDVREALMNLLIEFGPKVFTCEGCYQTTKTQSRL